MFEKNTYGEYTWETYAEVGKRVDDFGSGLACYGITAGHSVAIYSETCAFWQMTAQACFSRTIPVVTVYTSLGKEAVTHGINDSGVSAIVTDAKQLKLLRDISQQCLRVRTVIYFGEADPADLSGFSCDVLRWTDVETRGAQSPNPKTNPTPEDIAVIMYTSGSTGLPKGVFISHRNMLGVQAGLKVAYPSIDHNDTYLGYLPLAHVLELAAETTFLALGLRIGYGSPFTLTDASPKIKAGTKGDASTLRPTVIAAVPAIMDRIRKAVLAKVDGGSGLTKKLFHWALDRKTANLRDGGKDNHWFLNKIVFSKVTAMLGGRVRIMVSGGAPLSPETEIFMNACFCCKVCQGYGLTETCGVGTLCRFDDGNFGRVGAPIPCCEIKLVDWAEGGYTSQDQPLPRGEIVIGGPTVTMGYANDPVKTAECYKEEDGQRWFYTGDIGQFHPNGTLEIIDRKKDLVKLQMGEYVSLGKVESALVKCPMVENCCAFADSFHDYAIVMVVPNMTRLAEALGTDASDPEALVRDPAASDIVLRAIRETGQKEKLQRFEIPNRTILSAEPWTPENELVTAALKLKRENIKKAFAAQIKAAYS